MSASSRSRDDLCRSDAQLFTDTADVDIEFPGEPVDQLADVPVHLSVITAGAAPTLAVAVNASGFQLAAAFGGRLGGRVIGDGPGTRSIGCDREKQQRLFVCLSDVRGVWWASDVDEI